MNRSNDREPRYVLQALADVYPQLYLEPGDAGQEAYRRIVRLGEDALVHALDHFTGSPMDALSMEMTPAGAVQVVTLHERADFEVFLQIMAHRCKPVDIPPTQGASILDGVINWTKIRAHQSAFLRDGGNPSDWPAEFKRFTADKGNYTDALIVLSVGPYSAIPAERTGQTEEQWLADSQIIRRCHECTHFICRRLYPEAKDAIWDELVADAIGLYAAYNRYDRGLAEMFLGIRNGRYVGGRLENYVPDGAGRCERLDTLARKVDRTLRRIEAVIAEAGAVEPYALIPLLQAEQGCWLNI